MILEKEKKVNTKNEKEKKFGEKSSLWQWLCAYGIQINERERFGKQDD